VQFRGERRSSLAAIAEANRVLIAILKAEWGEPEEYHLIVHQLSRSRQVSKNFRYDS
jgi:hypothetical protein